MLISNHAVAAVSRLYAGSQPSGAYRPDALELSGEVQSFGDILQKLRGMDDVRPERVEALRARGQEPASTDIAAKMLAMRY